MNEYQQASLKTADNLRTVAHTMALQELSRLSLPEIDAAVELVGRLVPAGNVPGVILNGLARITGRKAPAQNVRRDVNLLFSGMEQVKDKAVFGAFFAGPAAVIWGYQNLVKLAGKDPNDSFPEGTWQFYVDYALRDDTARHTNETHGFDTTLNVHNIKLSAVDRATAWAMTAVQTLHHYPLLLENEWRERVHTTILTELSGGKTAKLYGQWERERPYTRGRDATASDTYPIYRRLKFDRFLAEGMKDLPEEVRRKWRERVKVAEAELLPAYQQQMSILAYLEPEAYGEKRTPVPLEQVHIGIIYRGAYYLLPVCQSGTTTPVTIHMLREQIATLMSASVVGQTISLIPLAELKRSALAGVRGRFAKSLDPLKYCPILLNLDSRSRQLPLAELRQTERGIGDHALTILDTQETIVFDQSHIFFDGAWGSALAEIMTNEALAWAVYLQGLASSQPAPLLPYRLTPDPKIAQVTGDKVTPEVAAERDDVNIKAILALRKVFKQRSDLLQLTVNDMLILFRAIHAQTYRPPADLVAHLQDLQSKRTLQTPAQAALESLHNHTNPAILIPVDASQTSPRERLYPMSFEVPLKDLQLLDLHDSVMEALQAYERGMGDRTELYTRFDELQRNYLATLAGFGAVMSRAKEIALAGESSSVGTIKLLAHMPTPLQRLLDNVPGKFEMLNDIIKGREVFSNVGAVVPTSTLTRFITAKDDNEKKTLAWGVITDAKGVLRISLRDFRPHVGLLIAAGRRDLAQFMVDDYLSAYTQGLNRYIGDLRRITIASRETRMAKIDIAELDNLGKS